MDWIANLCILVSTVLTAAGYPWIGFPVSIIGNVCFIAFGIQSGRRSFVIINPIYLAISMYGSWYWIERYLEGR